MLWIVSGPSSVGKTTFMGSPRIGEITGLPANAPVLFPSEKDPGGRDLAGCLLHDNMLRPAARFGRKQARLVERPRPLIERLLGRNKVTAPDAAAWREAALDFANDPSWAAIVARPVAKRAVVLVASIETILARVRARRVIEPGRDASRETYRPAEWLDLYARLDLPAIYRAWTAELTARGVDYVMVDGNDSEFRLLPNS